MEQSEIIRHQLVHPTGKATKQLLTKKGIEEKKPLRMIKVKTGLWFGTNEPRVSDERDEELRLNWIEKRTTSIVKI